MKTTRRSFSLAIAGIALAAPVAGFSRHAAAQDSTPEMTDMGNAMEALGIGAEGDAAVNVIHASPDAPAVDVAVTGGDVLISGLAFPSASDALEVPAGAYDLEVRPAGTTDVALALPGVQLEAGMVYDVFAIGQLGDGTLTVLVVPSMAAMPAATPAS